MRLEGFAVIAHFDEQRTLPVPCNYPRKSLAVSMLSANSFACNRVEFGRFSQEVRELGMYQLLSNGPSSR